MLFAMGAVRAERWLASLPRWGRRTIEAVYFAAFALVSAYVCAVILPLASSGPLKQFALERNGDLREEIGWDELVRTVAQIRDSLPADEQAHLGITTANYGEYGAIEILGRAYGLPEPDRHNQLRMVARLSLAAAHDIDRSRPERGASQRHLHRLPPGRAQR